MSGSVVGEGRGGKNLGMSGVHMAQPRRPCQYFSLVHITVSRAPKTNTDTSTPLMESAVGPGHLMAPVQTAGLVQYEHRKPGMLLISFCLSPQLTKATVESFIKGLPIFSGGGYICSRGRVTGEASLLSYLEWTMTTPSLWIPWTSGSLKWRPQLSPSLTVMGMLWGQKCKRATTGLTVPLSWRTSGRGWGRKVINKCVMCSCAFLRDWKETSKPIVIGIITLVISRWYFRWCSFLFSILIQFSEANMYYYCCCWVFLRLYVLPKKQPWPSKSMF